jgi:septation ring formation regulator EzrA
MTTVVLVALLVIIALAVAARWLFRQRSPDEIRAARAKIQNLRKPRDGE